MLEVVLELLFGLQIVLLVDEAFQFFLDLICVRVRFAQLKLRFISSELLIYGLLDANDASVDKRFEVVREEPEGLSVFREFALPVQAVVLLKVEHFLDEQEHLDQPILAELPVAEVLLQPELTRGWVDQRVEHIGLKVHDGHGFWVISRESHPELEHRVLVDALLAEVDTLPVRELWRRVHMVRWHQVDANWRVLLKQLVLQTQRLQSNTGKNRVCGAVLKAVRSDGLRDVGHNSEVTRTALRVNYEWVYTALCQAQTRLDLGRQDDARLRALAQFSRSRHLLGLLREVSHLGASEPGGTWLIHASELVAQEALLGVRDVVHSVEWCGNHRGSFDTRSWFIVHHLDPIYLSC